MKTLIAVLVLFAGFIEYEAARRPFVLVLGIAQDAGIPQIGCESDFCRRAMRDRALRQMVTSLAIIDPRTGGRWLIDATPDLPEQFDILKNASADRSTRLDGVFLTHAHIGHYSGLMYFGRESMNSSGIRVYAMPRMKRMLERNAPWSQLVGLGNIAIDPIEDGVAVKLNEELEIRPFLVPHRDEFSETVGYRISSGQRTVVFIPDIDKWQKWKTPLAEIVLTADHLLIDGTFFRDGEISRPMSEVPHPFVAETIELLKALPARERQKVAFIHFNHSNPLIQGDKRARAEVNRSGFGVAFTGQRIEL